MEIHFLVMEKSWKIIVEKRGRPGPYLSAVEIVIIKCYINSLSLLFYFTLSTVLYQFVCDVA